MAVYAHPAVQEVCGVENLQDDVRVSYSRLLIPQPVADRPRGSSGTTWADLKEAAAIDLGNEPPPAPTV